MSDQFDAAFEVLIGHEGGFTDNAKDPGNWTGGKVGKGRLAGTKFGISAASFPTLDIMALTLDQAKAIYRASYWTPARCDQLPMPAALIMFDAAVNNGRGNAIKFLQQATGATADGLIGTATLAALSKALGNGSPERATALAAEMLARRMHFMASLSTWPTFGLGWARRLCTLPFQGARLASATNT